MMLANQVIRGGGKQASKPVLDDALAIAITPACKLNKTEERYRRLLELQKNGGQIREYFVQAVTLKIGTDCRYLPDFLVVENDGTLTFVEIKGFMHAVGAAKFRVAQQMFWWARFKLVRRVKGQWVESDKAARNKRAGELASPLPAEGREAQ